LLELNNQEGSDDFPRARSLERGVEFTWDEDKAPVVNYFTLGRTLAETGDVFRNSAYSGGLILASEHPNIPPIPIQDPAQLLAVILDRVVIKVIKDGKSKGGAISAVHLRTMLRSEAFLQCFRAVDEVTDRPRYLAPDFRLTLPGYNDGGFGRRILHVGRAADVSGGRDAIERFLDVMAFETNADRVNTVGAALIVLLRNFWPGAKPIIIATSTKSHGGKETIISFVAVTAPMVSVGYQQADWALERQIVGALRQNPKTGLVSVDNARHDKNRYIRSAFLERYLTDPEPFLFSTGTGRPVRRRNDVVLAMSTNFGLLSEDLMNRSLPIRLDPVGDVTRRSSPIGNPKLEYLPAHRERIAAELRGMVERWKRDGRPLDGSLHHPFTECIRTIGGILQANGLMGFLGNLGRRRTADDPVRRALGFLGAARPNEFLSAADWASEAKNQGLVRTLIPEADRDGDRGLARGTGVVLSAHRDETFEVETDDARLSLKLEKRRGRFQVGDEPSTRYRFLIVDESPIPDDGAGALSLGGTARTPREGLPGSLTRQRSAGE
jgi:hypothetical protein